MPEVNTDSWYDAVVVGSGPAGSSAAWALSRAGLRVVLLEKALLPRYKTCGGGLLARTLRLLPHDLSAVVESECHQAELHHHSPRLTYSTLRDIPIVSMVMRDRFDHLLAQAAERAGTELVAGSAVLAVTVEKDRVRVCTAAGERSARFIVAADGVSSFVARTCGFPALRQVAPALECEITVEPNRLENYRKAARFDFGLTPHGYGWVFPKREHLSVGVLTTRRGCCNLHEEYDRYLRALGLGKPLTEQRHGYMIPLRPRDQLFDFPRVMLVGDAAGLADPITAEGISAAIQSGLWAASAIVENRANEAAARRAYRSLMETTLLADLRAARVLARGLYDFPRVRGWLLARHGQRLSEFVTDVVQGKRRYRDAVRRPGSYLKLFGR